jgi:hypothetical protein
MNISTMAGHGLMIQPDTGPNKEKGEEMRAFGGLRGFNTTYKGKHRSKSNETLLFFASLEVASQCRCPPL